MSIICITGPSHIGLLGVEKILHSSGMGSHRPLGRDASMNLLRWHERVLVSLKSTSSKLKVVEAQATRPSRMWEQLAVDLIVANMDSAHWGWAHTGSVDVLDFWAQLDPDIRFVLVCEDPTLLTSRLIEQGETVDDIARHLAQWEIQHQGMLRFHLRHTDISLMVWASDVTGQPEPFIHLLNEAWKTPFQADLAQGQACATPNLLLQQIAIRLLADYPQFLALAHELQAVLGPVQSIQFSGEVQTADLLSHYLQITDRSLENTQLQLVMHEAQVTQQTLQQELLSAKTHYEQDHREWLAHTEELKSANERALNLLRQTQEQLDKVVSEKQKVLSEYESQLRDKQELLVAKTHAQSQCKELQDEADLILKQLHQVQEELEKYYLQDQESRQAVKQQQERWIRAVQKHPAMLTFEALELLDVKGENLTLLWRVNQLNLNGRVLGPFQFRSVLEHGIAGFVFARDIKGDTPLVRWPAIATKENELTIIPAKGQDDSKKRTATIFQLGTTDWQLIEQLNALIMQTVSSGAVTLNEPQAVALVKGLEVQKQIFEAIPPILRFDSVKVLAQQNSTNKHVLALQFVNADLQGLRVSELEFQLQLNSLASGPSAHLIFAETCAHAPFSQWSGNVKNANGQPVMAMQIKPQGWEPKLWHKLSAQDQQWLKSIVTVLPGVWAALQAQGTAVQTGWPHWMQAASDLRNWSQQGVAPQVNNAVVAKGASTKTDASLLPVATPKTKPVSKPAQPPAKVVKLVKVGRQPARPAAKTAIKPSTKTARRVK